MMMRQPVEKIIAFENVFLVFSTEMIDHSKGENFCEWILLEKMKTTTVDTQRYAKLWMGRYRKSNFRCKLEMVGNYMELHNYSM